MVFACALTPFAARESRAQQAEAGAPRVITEIVVQGAKLQPLAPPKAPHVSGSVVRGDVLTQPGIRTAEVLRESPGVQVSEMGGFGAPATASLRGATAAQTAVYLGGVRLNDEVGGAANLADVPLFLVDRIEVYRSHAPLVADRLSPGGALLFEPRRPERHELRLSAMTGSFGTRGASGYASLGELGRGVLAGFELAAAENDYPFHDSRGTLYQGEDDRSSRLPNADASMRSLWVHARERVGDGSLGLLFHHAGREQGAPKLALVPSQRARVAFERDLVAITAEAPLAALNGNLELTTSALQSSVAIADPLRELGLATDASVTSGQRVEQSAVVRQRLGGDLRLSQQANLSIERLQRTQRALPGREGELTAERFQTRVAFGAELPLARRWHVDAVLALTCSGTSDGGRTGCEAQEPGGRVGGGYRSEVFEVYANAGRYQRFPTLSELYGTSLLVRGNPELELERGTTVELGTRAQVVAAGRRLVWIDVASFARHSEDLVTFVRAAQGYLHPVNRAAARTLGGELAVGTEPWRWLDASVVASVLDARDRSPDRRVKNDLLPFISRLTAAGRLGLRWDVDERWLSELRLGARALYQSSRYADPAGLGVLPEQFTLDGEVSATTLQEQLTTRLRWANVLDNRRFDVVGFPLPGRSVFWSMEATW